MKLSIIVPIYNGERYVKSVIENVIKQKYEDFELIIINDGSTDNTKVVCDSIENLDSRVKIIHKENEGVSTTRNMGIEIASGEYITFLDCDDRIDFSMYKNMVDKLEEEAYDLVMCSYTIEYDAKNDDKLFPWEDREFKGNDIVNRISLNMLSSMDEDGSFSDTIMGSTWRCIFKKSIIEKNNLRFDKTLKIAEDLIFMLEYLNECKSVYTTNKCYYFYNQKTDQLSATQKYSSDLEDTLDRVDKKILEILSNIPNLKETKIWYLREVTHICSLVVNASLKSRNIGFVQKRNEVRDMIKRRDLNYYLSRLDKNQIYCFNNLVVACLKYGFYSIVVKYYSR
ncbi:MAG: glycosyltransferase family 2 protein [Sarcina sp.]